MGSFTVWKWFMWSMVWFVAMITGHWFLTRHRGWIIIVSMRITVWPSLWAQLQSHVMSDLVFGLWINPIVLIRGIMTKASAHYTILLSFDGFSQDPLVRFVWESPAVAKRVLQSRSVYLQIFPHKLLIIKLLLLSSRQRLFSECILYVISYIALGFFMIDTYAY